MSTPLLLQPRPPSRTFSSCIFPTKPPSTFLPNSRARRRRTRTTLKPDSRSLALSFRNPKTSFAFECGANRRESEPSFVSDGASRRPLQALLWLAGAVYVVWLFLLPFAPGDPVWAISSQTIDSLIGLSLNFFFVLPLINAAGVHVLEAPVLHPVSEGLFNFVIGWTLMFAPLLFTDRRRDRYKASLDVLWGLQMFLTNTFLIPYMAIRLNEADPASTQPSKPSQLSSVMSRGASIVALSGGVVCLVSVLWALFGRTDGSFGGITERLNFFFHYVGEERLAYAFIWDICLYTVFQPWLICDNLQNVERSKVETVKYLGFVPVVGLIAYLLSLNLDKSDET